MNTITLVHDDKPVLDPMHPCQTEHRSYPRHYWITLAQPDGTYNLLHQRCTTCGKIERELDRWDGQ